MSNAADMKPVLDFLSDLRAHNERTWFEQHRDAYERARQEFEAFVAELITGLGRVENLGGLDPKDCIMRIYRDVRFSKDKSPYKTGMGASIAPGGKKSSRLPYHLHVEPHGHSMMAGGLYMPTPAQLNRFREAIDRDAAPFKSIVNTPEFKRAFGSVGGETVKTAPQGYTRDHPEIDLLRLKQVVVMHPLTDEAVLSAEAATHIVQMFKTMKPFIDYLNMVSQ